MLTGFTDGISRVLGYSAPSSTITTPASIVAEPDTTTVAFPAIGSQQRARTSAAAAPTLSLSPPGADSDHSGDDLSDPQDDDRDDDQDADLPPVRVTASGPLPRSSDPPRSITATATASGTGTNLLPPTSTTKVVKAPKGRVRVEKGFSQLDWAKLNRSGDVDLRGGVDSLLRVTPSELAKHNSRQDCWQVYAGRVYNVGPFLRYHPGGVGEMMRGAGKDATQLFMLAHAWVNYETLLENCLVGFLVPEPEESE